MRYIYFPSGRTIWLDVAALLEEEAGFMPTIWLGDNELAARAADRFPDASVYDFFAINRGELPGNGGPEYEHTPPQGLLQTHEMSVLKDQVLKMMDRQDVVGRYRRVDREAVFYRILLHFYNEVRRREPALLISAEAPHSPAQMIIYGLCRMLAIPTVHFASSPLVPVMFLRTSLDSPYQERSAPWPERHLERIMDGLDEYLGRFSDDPDYDSIEPEFMRVLRDRNQKRKASSQQIHRAHDRRGVRDTQLLSALALFKNKARHVLKKPRNKARRLLRKPRNKARRVLKKPWKKAKRLVKRGRKEAKRRLRRSRIWMREELAKHSRKEVPDSYAMGGGEGHELVIESRRMGRHIRRALAREYEMVVSREPATTPYVFFALHYEPERTTNPEGGAFYNQYDAIFALRAAMPADMALVVREHPAQFRLWRAYLGRSPLFYSDVDRLPNTRVVSSLEWDPIRLQRDAELVATVTGTAGLEAVCLGKKALIFGHPWYEGCPGVYPYSPDIGFRDLLNEEGPDLQDVRQFLERLVRSFGIPGVVNPSGERFQDAYLDIIHSPESAPELANALIEAGTRIRAPSHRAPDGS